MAGSFEENSVRDSFSEPNLFERLTSSLKKINDTENLSPDNKF